MRENRQRFEDLLCALLLFMGLGYCLAAIFLGAPFQLQADEGRRWARAYALSEGVVFTRRTGPSTALARFNAEASAFERDLLGPVEAGSQITREDLEEISKRRSEAPYRAADVNVASETFAPAVLYLPGALGISVGRALHLEFWSQLRLARLLSFAAVCCALMLIWRLAGRHRMPVIAGLLLPGAVGLYPALEHGALAALAPVVAVLGFLQLSRNPEPAGGRTFAALACLFLVLCLAKPPFSIFAICALVIPARRFGGQARKLLLLTLCGLPALAVLAWWNASATLDMMQYFGRGKAQPEAQLASILADPIGFLSTVWRTWTTLHPENLAGGLLPYVPPPHPLLDWLWAGFIPPALLLMASALRPASSPKEQRAALGPLVLLCAAATVLLFYLGFFLSFTAPGDERIEGVAARYFLPFAPIFALALRECLPQGFAAPRVSALLFLAFALCCGSLLALGLWAQTEWLRL